MVQILDSVVLAVLVLVGFMILTQPTGTGLIAITIPFISTDLGEDFTIPIIYPTVVFMGDMGPFTTPILVDMVIFTGIHTTETITASTDLPTTIVCAVVPIVPPTEGVPLLKQE